ncbi:hypothetical protein ACEPAG_131 [Sanghuangporus baumii]
MQFAACQDPRVHTSPRIEDTGTDISRHQTVYIQAPYRHHGHNSSLGAPPTFAHSAAEFGFVPNIAERIDENQPIALTHSFVNQGPQRARTISYPGPGHRPTRSLCSSSSFRKFNRDKPLPLLPPPSPALSFEFEEKKHADGRPTVSEPTEKKTNMSVGICERGDANLGGALGVPGNLSGSNINREKMKRGGGTKGYGEKERADESIGSWLDGYEHDEGRDSFLSTRGPFDLDDYLSRSAPSSPSPQPSTITERPQGQTRAFAPPSSTPLPAKSKSTEHIRDQLEFFGNRVQTPSFPSANTRMSSFVPQSMHPEVASVAKSGLTRPGSDGEGLYDVSSLRQPKVDPSNFPDPYPHGISYHQGTPTLSSAGSSSASTRSSAYTNPGSTISASGYSGDYSHVRVASGDDFEGAGGIGGIGVGLGINMAGAPYHTDSVVEKLARTSTGSSISRKSHAPSHAPHVPLPRMRHTRALHSQSQSQSEDFSAQFAPVERLLRSQPSYDTSWQRQHEDLGASEDEYDYGQDEEYEDAENYLEMEEEQPCSAISVVEEGRGLIVHGEGISVHALHIQPGITHLLVGGSSTPNSVPAFLTTMLPQISTTLLALDISANFLVSLSPAFASCASLEELNISANPLRVLPEFLAHLTSLRLLLADSTGISTMPASLSALQKLHTLSIRRNKMHALPSWLCTLPCLESLLVDGNPFQGPWKALVDPLLAKAPMTPAYPPSTPFISPPSATPISATNTTSVETSDVSDTEDYTDQDENNHPAPSAITTSSLSAPTSADDNLEEDTITPAQARLLERSATSPPPHDHGASSPPPLSRPLSRVRTTPNRGYYERVKQSRSEQEIAGLSSPALVAAEDRVSELSSPIPSATSPSTPNLMLNPSRDLRRMRSADELRRATSATSGVQATGPLLSSTSSPPRPGLTHYATTSSASVISEGMEGGSLQRRFASLNVHARSSSRASMRPLASNLFTSAPMPEEDADADVESPPATMSRARAATAVSITRGGHDEEYERRVHQSLAKPQKGKEKSSRKWGFLKKMSMGKLRSTEGTSGFASPPSSTRPSTSSGASGSSMGKAATASLPSASVTLRQLSRPQVEVALTPSNPINALSATGSPFPPANLLRNASTDKLKLASPSTPSAASLLAPPSPMAKSGKRRSFLPVDGPPALNIPIPSTSSFLGGITATNGSEDQDDGTRLQSPGHAVESPLDMQEERNREANARALRSVMAYLRDMNDLTLLSQGNSLSMYGGSAPMMERSRRPTFADSQRLTSETSMDSNDSASSAPTTASSHLRSFDSFNANRSGSLNTMSVATSDSSGSGGEERKCKDDRGKRLMIVREIVETERTYVKNLQELVDIYVRPAAAPVNSIGSVGSSSKETVVPAAERKIVFGGLEALYTFHKESFFPALEAAAGPLLSPQGAAADADSDGKLSSEVAMAVGRTFVAHAAFMKMYSSYINNFENSVARIRQWVSDRSGTGTLGSQLTPSSSTVQLANVGLTMSALAPNSMTHDSVSGKAQLTSSQRKRLKHYLKRCRVNPRHSQLNLEGYLLLPVQRIPRYRLLLEDLTRSTPPPETYDDPLDRALAEISSLATNMNEGKREAESRKKLVMWQSRIRGRFPSPLVQPHRRLIMDGKLLLTRIVRKQTMAFEVLDSHGDAANVAVDCLAPELTPRPLYGILCNDLFVLCRDPSNGQDPNASVDLWAVLRMQTMPQPTSIVHGNTLRIVDSKAILYLEAPSTSEALTWFRGEFSSPRYSPVVRIDLTNDCQ